MHTTLLHVSVARSGNTVSLLIGEDVLSVQVHASIPMNATNNDFAVWYALPIAMRLGKNLHIEGVGSRQATANALRMSEIWETWLPGHFSTVQVSFDHYEDPRENSAADPGTLVFYSGGVDSTFSLLARLKEGKQQTLLTVHGMDYKQDDDKRFAALVEKTKVFSRTAGEESILVKANARDIYKKHRVNPESGEVAFIFNLSGAGFLFSERFGQVCIAADYTLAQEYLAHPYGSNSATNPLFASGTTSLITCDTTVSRFDKAAILATAPDALAALSFCKRYKFRPHNCGLCQKCLRTKLMFLGATGQIPDIFHARDIPKRWIKTFDLTKKTQKTFLLDILVGARRNGRLDQIPDARSVLQRIKKPDREKNLLRYLKRQISSVVKK
jgi:hypothetical protein